MNRENIYLYILLVFLILFISCGGDPEGINYREPNPDNILTEGPSSEDDPNLNESGMKRLIPDLNYNISGIEQASQLSGQSEQIVAENCGNTTSVVQVSEIHRLVEAKVFLKLSTTAIKEFGEFDYLAVDVISNEIELILGIDRLGIETEFTSALTIITEPETITITTIQWRETWTTGDVEITRPDGSVVDTLPFSCLSFIILEVKDVEVIECDSNTVAAISQRSKDFIPTEPLHITDVTNNKNFVFSLPASTNAPPRNNLYEICGNAYLETGNEEVEYHLTVPEGWTIIIDSWQADWPRGGYCDDGILIIYGEWEGEVSVNKGSLCGIPTQWKDEALSDRRATTNNDGRTEYIIYSTSNKSAIETDLLTAGHGKTQNVFFPLDGGG